MGKKNNTYLFSFVPVFLFFSLFLFVFLFVFLFPASGITCIWFSIEKMCPDVIFSFPDVPFLSVIVRRLASYGQRCQNKISFDRLQPEQIKQDEVRYSKVIWVVYAFQVFFWMFIVFISFYFCYFLFISCYILLRPLCIFLAKNTMFLSLNYFFNAFFWFWEHQKHVLSNPLRPAALFSLAELWGSFRNFSLKPIQFPMIYMFSSFQT